MAAVKPKNLTATQMASMCRAYTEPAIRTLVGIMTSEAYSAADRRACAEALLNRGWGKPKETIAGDQDAPLWIRWMKDGK